MRKCVEHQQSSLDFLTEKKCEQLPQALPNTNMNFFLLPCPSHHNENNIKPERKNAINIKTSREKWSH